jgi:hypothetical protein
MAASTELVFHEDFHPDTVAAINELREIRLGSLIKMKDELKKTAAALGASSAQIEALKEELKLRIEQIKNRLANPNRIFADELELYMELLANPEG